MDLVICMVSRLYMDFYSGEDLLQDYHLPNKHSIHHPSSSVITNHGSPTYVLSDNHSYIVELGG
jgi:hypothetical protein